MKFKTYFRIALVLPIVVGAIVGWFFIKTPAGILALAIMAEWKAYLALIFLAWLISLRSSQKGLELFSLVLPLTFIPIVLVKHVIDGSINSMARLLESIVPFGLFIVVVGYFYVAVVWAIWHLYSKIKNAMLPNN